MKKLFIALIAMLLVLAGCTGGASEKEIKLHRSYEAAHGDKAFTRVVVALDGDKILDVAIDEFQVFDAGAMTAVPNTDGAFGAGFAAGRAVQPLVHQPHPQAEQRRAGDCRGQLRCTD